MDELAIQRLRDGRFYKGGRAQADKSWSDTPKFVRVKPSRAEVIIRVDLGMDLDEVRILTREQIAGMRPEDLVFGGCA